MQQHPEVGVGVLIFNKHDEVLLGQRVSDNDNEYVSTVRPWTAPGGKQDIGESWRECAQRETREECGLEINQSALEIVSVSDDLDKQRQMQYTTIGFHAHEWTGTPRVREPDTIDPWRWFSLTNLPQQLFLPTKHMLENLLAERLFRELQK